MDKDWLKVGHSHENFVWSLLSLRHSPHTPRLTLCRSGEKKEIPPYNSAGCQFKPPLIVRLVVCPSSVQSDGDHDKNTLSDEVRNE